MKTKIIMNRAKDTSFEKSLFSEDIDRTKLINQTAKITIKLLQLLNIKENESIIIIPILRGGLPMWMGAIKIFKNSETVFVVAERNKSNTSISINLKNIRENWENKTVIILDTIIATGNTINEVVKKINSNLEKADKIFLMCCYSNNLALEKIKALNVFNKIISYKNSESIDQNGFLIPYTNGDIGFKMFG